MRDCPRPPGRRWLAIGAALAAGVASAGLGSGCGGGGGDLARPLSYFPANAPAVALLSTELDDDQWHSFNGTIAPLVLHASVRQLIRETSNAAGLSFGDDVKALLGNPLVVGVVTRGGLVGGRPRGRPRGAAPTVVAALQLREPGRLAKVLRAFAFAPAGRVGRARLYRRPVVGGTRFRRRAASAPGLVAVDGDVLVTASSDAALRRALAQPRRPGRLTPDIVRRGLHGLPGGALLRVYGSLRGVATGASARSPWVRALRSYAVAVSVRRHVIEAKGIVRTASGAINAAQLPLARGHATAAIPARTDEAVVGLRNAAPTAAFAISLLSGQRAGPRVGGLLALAPQLTGPAFAAFDPDGDLWVRARVRDRRAAARALRVAAPRLGLRPAGGGLYRGAGGPPFVGIVGHALVAGPDRRGVRDAADEPTVILAGARGALVARADLGGLGPELERLLGIQLGPLDEAIAYAWADRAGIRTVLRLGIR